MLRNCRRDAPKEALVAFVVAAILGQLATVAILWDLGMLIAMSAMPFGGAILIGVLAAGQRT